MKNLFVLLFSCICFTGMYAQSPKLINYQGVARDASGNALTSQNIALKFEFKRGSSVLFSETQSSIATNALGLFSTQIGKVNLTDLAQLNWEGGQVFLEVSVDVNNGTDFTSMGQQQLVSVPYALHAATVPSSYADNVLTIGNKSYTLSATGTVPASVTATAGIATVTATGTNSFDINVPAPVYDPVAGALTTGTAVTNITPSLSLSGGNILTVGPASNSITLPSGTFVATPNTTLTGTGAANVTSPAVNAFSVDVPVTVIAPGTNVAVAGAYPNFTVSSTPSLVLSNSNLSISGGNTVTLPSAVAPTLALSGNTLSTVGGNSLSLPTASFSQGGAVTISTLSTNSYSISVPVTSIAVTSTANTASVTSLGTNSLSINIPTVGLAPGTNVNITGSYPNYTISTTAGSSPTITGAGISTVTSSGNNYTVNVATPTLTGLGTTTVTGAYPNYSINTTAAVAPTLTGAGTTTVSGTFPNYTISTTAGSSPTITGEGISTVASSGNNYTVNVATPTLTGAGSTTVSGAYPNYTINTALVSSPTITGTGASTVTSSGNNYTVNVATPTLTGLGTTTVSGAYPNYSINTAAATIPTLTGAGITTVSGSYPNYTVSTAAAVAPTLTGAGTTTVSGTFPNYTISTTAGSSPTITGAGISTVASSGNNYTVNVATPTLTGLGTTTVTGAYPNYSINTAAAIAPTLTGAGTTTVSGTFPNYTISTTAGSSPTITGAGISTVASSGNNYTVNVATPTLTGLGTTTVTGAYPNYSINTSGITGSGTSNYLSKWGGANNLTNSILYDDGINVGIGTNAPSRLLSLKGAGVNSETTFDFSKTGSGEFATLGIAADNDGNALGGSALNGKTFFHSWTKDMQISTLSGGNNIEFGTNNGINSAIRMIILGSGNVGIGTTSPAQALDVNGNIRFSGGLMPNGSAGTAGQVLLSAGTGSPPVWSTLAATGWGLTGNAGTTASNFIGTTDAQDLVFKSNNVEVFRAQSAGVIRLAAGADRTITMQTQTSNIDANSLFLRGSDAGTGGQARYGGSLILQGGDGFNQSNAVHFGGSVIIRPGKNQYGAATYNGGSIFFQNVNSSNVYYEMARFADNGNFGLGITTPSEKLDVTGNVKFSGALMPGNNAGTTGQILVSAGAGSAPSWSTAVTMTSAGTANYLPRWSAGSALTATSQVYDNGTNVGIGTNSPANARLMVVSTSADAAVAASNGSSTTSALSLLVDNGHIATTASNGPSAVTAQLLLFAGISLSSNSTDVAGKITFNTILGGSGSIATITFAKPYANVPVVVLTPLTANAASLDYYVTNVSTTGFQIATSSNAPILSGYAFNYFVIETR